MTDSRTVPVRDHDEPCPGHLRIVAVCDICGALLHHAHTERPAHRAVSAPPALSSRQQEIAGLVSRGATNKEIASRLHLSAKTVEYHLSGIYRRLGIRSRTDLARVHLHRREAPRRAPSVAA